MCVDIYVFVYTLMYMICLAVLTVPPDTLIFFYLFQVDSIFLLALESLLCAMAVYMGPAS